MIILVDLDDTLEQLVPSWCEALNKKYNFSTLPSQILSWDILNYFPSLTKEELYAPLEEEAFWDEVKEMPEASKYLKKLIGLGHEVFILSSTSPKTVNIKYEKIITKYFPFISWKNFIICHNKSLVHGDIIIDDGIHNLIDNHSCKYKFLFNQPHNSEFDNLKYGILRVNSWEEIYHKILELSEELKN